MSLTNLRPPPKTALITGAAKRIGRAIALALAADGYAVALHHYRSVDEAHALAEEIRTLGGHAVPVAADLLREEQVAALVARAATALAAPVTLLVNNASLFEYDSVESTTRRGWDRHMEVNVRAPFVLCQALVAGLPDTVHGCIVNLIDQRVWNLTPHFVSYTLSKVGLWTLTQTLALALAPRIRVNAIGPGPALPSSRQTRDDFVAQEVRMPLEHGTNPEEIAQAVRFLVACRSMTGQMLALDGGQHLCWAPAREADSLAVE